MAPAGVIKRIKKANNMHVPKILNTGVRGNLLVFENIFVSPFWFLNYPHLFIFPNNPISAKTKYPFFSLAIPKIEDDLIQ